jgi:microcystin-dependent protein
LYYGGAVPELPWLLCDGTTVSRDQFPKLFALIGVKHGAGDGFTTFSLPDFRNRFPVGAESLASFGQLGGRSSHALSIDQLPKHAHDVGSLSTSDGGAHDHPTNDPGHNHGGQTGEGDMSFGNLPMMGRKGHGNDWGTHRHTIPWGPTNIQVLKSGTHKHSVTGSTGSTGQGSSFSILPPFFKINYVIYAD